MSILPNQIVKFNSVPQLVLLCQQYIYVQIKHFFSNNFFIQKALTVGCWAIAGICPGYVWLVWPGTFIIPAGIPGMEGGTD